MIASTSLWWWTQLWGLPDIGEPFDVAAFRSFTIPDDRNAFVLYQKAGDRLKPWDPHRKVAGNRVDLKTSWSKAIPELRKWVEENREAMELYRQGTERPDALDPDSLEYRTKVAVVSIAPLFPNPHPARGLASGEQGDMAGAWVWCRGATADRPPPRMHGSPYRWIASSGGRTTSLLG